MSMNETAADTTEFRRLSGPSMRDLITPGLISMGLVILSWVVERWLAGT
jgi:hypothetical protein